MNTIQKVQVELDLAELKELIKDGLRYRGYRNPGEPQFFISLKQPHWPEDFAAHATLEGATIIVEQP